MTDTPDPSSSSDANAKSSGPPLSQSLYFIEHLFPSKLWRILDDADRCGYSDIISWVDDGLAFQIHDRESVIPILEKYFNMSKYKSFLRQLQAYGFQRSMPNPKDDPNRDSKPKRDCYRGKWRHKLFRRDKMNLCNKMTRDGKSKQQESGKDRSGSSSNSSISSDGSSGSGSSKRFPRPSKISSSTATDDRIKAAEAVIKQDQQIQNQGLLLKNHLIHHQHQPLGGPSPAAFHDARFSQQQTYLLPQGREPSPYSAHALGGFSQESSVLAQVKQQQIQQQQDEERHRQLTLQLNQLKEQQLLSSILAARTASRANRNASPVAGGAAASTSSEIAHTAAVSAALNPPPSMLGGVNYNEAKRKAPSSESPASSLPPSSLSKIPLVHDPVSEAASELRRAELALLERRKRFVEAQEQAKKDAQARLREGEVEAATKRLIEQSTATTVAGLLNNQHHRHLVGAPTTAHGQFSTTGASGQGEKQAINLPSLLQDLDNAFRSSGAMPTNTAINSGNRTIANSNDSSNNNFKITPEELRRISEESISTGKIPIDHHNYLGRNAPAPATLASSDKKELLMSQLTDIERLWLREQQQKQTLTHTDQQQQFLLRMALEERERLERERAVLGNASNVSNDAVRDAIRNAALGLITGHGNNDGDKNNSSGIHGRHSPHDLRQGTVTAPDSHLHAAGVGLDGSKNSRKSAGTGAAALHTASTGLLPAEVMDVFAQTAAAAIAKKNESTNLVPSVSLPASAPSTLVTVTAPTSPSNPPSILAAADKASMEKSGILYGVSGASNMPTASDSSAKTRQGAAVAIVANPQKPIAPKPSSSDELEAARALMRFPGSVSQSKGPPVRGHWELVRPEVLRADGPLAKQLPEAVVKAVGLSYESYKQLAMNMSPPRVMQIPDAWNPNNEPMYLVVDPVNASAVTQIVNKE